MALQISGKHQEEIRLNEQLPVGAGKSVIERFASGQERSGERPLEVAQEGETTKERTVLGVQPTASAAAPIFDPAFERRGKAIENIMSAGLEDLYLALDPAKQQEFRVQGEQTAAKVNALLNETKVRIAMIFNLIKNWLALLPVVNRYFQEQEAKIKVDEILQLKKGGE
jgi:hypothetical protein